MKENVVNQASRRVWTFDAADVTALQSSTGLPLVTDLELLPNHAYRLFANVPDGWKDATGVYRLQLLLKAKLTNLPPRIASGEQFASDQNNCIMAAGVFSQLTESLQLDDPAYYPERRSFNYVTISAMVRGFKIGAAPPVENSAPMNFAFNGGWPWTAKYSVGVILTASKR